MTSTSADPAPPRPRGRPFGVLVICLLLLFRAATLAVGAWGFMQVDTNDGPAVAAFLSGLGINTSFLTLADSVRFGEALLLALLALTLLQVVLVFMLRRSGWVLTMLAVGVNLALALVCVWQGMPAGTVSMAVLAVAALYLNQTDVRDAFGVGAGRIDAVLARAVEAGEEAG